MSNGIYSISIFNDNIHINGSPFFLSIESDEDETVNDQESVKKSIEVNILNNKIKHYPETPIQFKINDSSIFF